MIWLKSAGFFIKYDYSLMRESDFQSVFTGMEFKIFYYLKAAIGCGYTWFERSIPVDEKEADLKRDFSSFDVLLLAGFEFDIIGNYCLGIGISLVPRGSLEMVNLQGKWRTYYLEVSKRL